MTYKQYMQEYHNIDILSDEYQDKSEKIKQYYKQEYLAYKEQDNCEK